ncbi:PREDICTED: uncharacterized protein LOC105364287 [Ceratosolen solmsi marchali]|uniref:Uncharacterized protein LOC105364287 n=1 Tax=Ceratosolen solmsi marchali TaxID=326594 RepID=A0AAJ6YLV4_9HYME|nr:PREDICTED: uncharacterized protein LOC105364287 [Ceratosolen solmsi marchali]
MCSSMYKLCRGSVGNPCSSPLPLFAKKFILRFGHNRCIWNSVENRMERSSSLGFFNQERFGSASKATTPDVPGVLSKDQARQLAVRLTSDERQVLITALQECQSLKLKAEYEGQLAPFRWRSKFGRPTKVTTLGDVDPTGSYCAVPDDWLLRKYVETVPHPSRKDLMQVAIANAIPFIGFGFLDNSIMIIAGDSIEATLGVFISLSTMAAAAFGNTISDILGIGSAFYVELFAQKVGFEAPKLTPIQLDLPKSRRAANIGRVFGVTLGCLLGMLPLLVLHKDGKDEKKTKTDEKETENNKK